MAKEDYRGRKFFYDGRIFLLYLHTCRHAHSHKREREQELRKRGSAVVEEDKEEGAKKDNGKEEMR